MAENVKNEYNPERGSITAYVGTVAGTGSWGVEGEEGYFEWHELGVNINENDKSIILSLGTESDDGGVLFDLLSAKALRSLLDVAIQYLEDGK